MQSASAEKKERGRMGDEWKMLEVGFPFVFFNVVTESSCQHTSEYH